jgi:hypothetical protein
MFEDENALRQDSRSPLSTDVARSVQLHASRRENRFPEVRLVVVAQGAAYGRNGLCSQWYESGI